MAFVSTQESTVIAKTISGDYRVDVLLEAAEIRWNAPGALKSPVTVSYSFAETVNYLTGNYAKGFLPFTEAQRSAVRETFALISNQFNISFSEVKEIKTADTAFGQIRFSNNTQSGTAGYAVYPPENGVGTNYNGDNFINNEPRSLTDFSFLSSLGLDNFSTIIHEILHSLGIKHPGNYNAGEPPSPEPGNFLIKTEDNNNNSIMSYIDNPQGLQRIDLGLYDMLAMSFLYGTKAFRPESNQYVFSNTTANQDAATSVANSTNTAVLMPNTGRFLQLVNDTGGNNSFNFQSMSAGVIVNLGQGQSSSAGFLSDGTTAAINNIQIAFGTEINTVVGSKFDDILVGNSGANSITGGLGNDTIDGGSGIDTAVYSGTKSNYSLKFISPANISVTDISGTKKIDTLVNIERLKFGDISLAIDVAGNAGTTAKILGSVFGPSSVANKSYMGIGLSYLDAGMTYANLMQLAINARLGGVGSNTDVVNLLYTNVVGSAPDAATLAYYKGLLDNGTFTQASLGVLAADTSANTTNINLIGLAATGVEFV